MKTRTPSIRAFIALLAVSIAPAAAAQGAYPSKPIRLISPYATGGSTTTVARLVGQKLTERWGQQVIIDNRPGGSTIIGSEALVRSAADGYTIMMVSVDHTIIPQLLPTPYDATRDFAPITTVASSPLMVAVHPSVPANNLQELIALAKSRPGELNYAQTGNGTISHLMGEMFNVLAGVKTQDVAYKGGGPAIIDLLAGQVQLTFNTPINLVPHIRAGKLRPIVVAGARRLPSLPDVPVSAEAGLPGFEVDFWLGLLAPAGTPKEIIDKLATEVTKILSTPDFGERLVGAGMAPFISTTAQFSALIDAERAKYAKVIKAANIKL
jgi:tripartite-type tricarboxylate transporter receptor subunit TctC